MLEEILCAKLLGENLSSRPPEHAPIMQAVAASYTVEGLLTCMAAAVRAQAAVDTMANCRLQAEQLWMTIGQAARGE